MDARDKAAADYDIIAMELEQAAKHARTAGQHLRDRNVPSSAAHTFALMGHIEVGREVLAERAKFAASVAQP